MTIQTLFYVVFIAQIFLLSAYFPGKIIKRMRFIQKEYPASSHPKLYPKSSNFFQKSISAYRFINTLLFILGWVIVYFIYEGSLVSEKGIHPMLPWGYFMIQMMPSLWLEIFGFKMAKLMKQDDTRTQKSANLAPRHLLQYISPWLLLAVILTYIAAIVFVFFTEDFKFEFGSKAFLISVILSICYVFFFSMIAWLIRGKKFDPYQSQKDRTKTASLVIKTFCYTMIACAFFMGFSIAVATYQLKSMMPVAMSLFLQFLVVISTGFMLQNNRLEDIDFDVYKADSTAK